MCLTTDPVSATVTTLLLQQGNKMPNWCDNSLTLAHDDSTMIDRAETAFKQGKLLNEFIPVPADLTDTVSGYMGDEDSQRALEQRQAENIAKYGYPTWYEFCIANYGTKWDVGGENCLCERTNANTLTVRFDSAWSPPTRAYEQLEDQGFEIDAAYYEPGMSFCGIYQTDGTVESYEIAGDSEWVRDNIPAELDQLFGISESMAEWERDESEWLDENQDEDEVDTETGLVK
jgi:hypothetical protein